MRNALLSAILVVLSAVPLKALDWHVNPPNGHLYAAVHADTWDEGEAFAVSLGGHLVAISDAAENDWVLTNVLDPSGALFAWIGLYQLSESPEPADGWVWSSGEPVTYTNWNQHSDLGPEPNNAGGGENWAEMYCSYYATAGTWNDIDPYVKSESPHMAVIEVVPEPSSALALLCGVAGLKVAISRRRR